jgi:MFS family permease
MMKWRMWGLLLPTYFIAFMHRTALSSVGDDLAAAFALQDSVGTVLGLLAGIYFLVYSLLQLPSGILADSLGPRTTVSTANMIMGIATLFFAYSENYTTAAVARFFIGFGGAFNFIALLRIQVNWFSPKLFPLLTSLTVVTGNAGGLFGIGPFALITDTLGWRTSFMLLGCITLAFVPVILLMVRDSPVKSTLSGEGAFRMWKALRLTIANPVNSYMFAGFGLSSGVFLTFAGFWGVPFLQHRYGFTVLSASTTLTMLSAGMIAGSLCTPVIAKITGDMKKTALIMLGTAGVLWMIVVYVKIPQHAFPFLPGLVLFCLGFFLSAFILAYAIVLENNHRDIAGTSMSYVNMGGFTTVAVLQPVIGVILDRFVPVSHGGIPVYPFEAYAWAFSLLVAAHWLSVAAFACIRGAEKAGHQ